jgi:hypothetical protein
MSTDVTTSARDRISRYLAGKLTICDDVAYFDDGAFNNDVALLAREDFDWLRQEVGKPSGVLSCKESVVMLIWDRDKHDELERLVANASAR